MGQQRETRNVEQVMAATREQYGNRRCTRVDPVRYVNRSGLTVTDCATCGRPLEPTLKRANHYQHVPEGLL